MMVMTPKLYGHPFSSYTWKALIAFNETGAPHEFITIAPDAPEAGRRLHDLCPFDRFPVLETDEGAFWESSVIVEWAQAHAAQPSGLIPGEALAALRVRERDRIFDGYVMTPMQTVVGNALRPEDQRDPFGVTRAQEALEKAYAWLDGEMATRTWAAGEAFTLADCSAAPSLFYADWVRPLGGHPNLAAYLKRLRARPSVRAVVEAARPYRSFFPLGVPAHAD
jgi:glutathione S-transferase